MSSAALLAGQQSTRQPQQPAQDFGGHIAQQQQQQQQQSTSSPASSRRQPRSSGGNGSSPNTPRQPQYSSQGTSPAMSTPRGQQMPASSSHASPADYDPYNYAGHSQPQATAPPRTSSQQYTSPAYHDGSSSSRTPQQYSSGYGSGSDRERVRDDNTRAAAPAAQSARRNPRGEDEGQYYTSGRDQRSRQEAPQVSSSVPEDESAIINRLVIADPQEDVERERARVAEARGEPVRTDVTPIAGLGMVGLENVEEGTRGHRSRQEHLRTQQPRKETKFGEYILGQTVGEGEFGKVKMGWKKEGGVQVAIKLIRRESVGSNPNRLTKIYREIAILRELQHPNIVRLHEMVETERHIGIILEYASGGELFDYILNHRYLKDNAARRLFAQLVSGVGYLHKKGIVHRDLKLENLLLDRNRNIIITDFGFANTFNPNDELGEEIEYNLSSKEFVQRMGLDQIQQDGHRRGDLMQTSCGSPCYAAPELVVSDSLYTGRKVDVWSCGVILYAMLAGYLPFDDDPANPEGDNINLLYKYIVSTPLTFPEYVTPHARDLLRRILVPDPRKRADLFEVARHSWLSEYAHVVAFITSSTTTTNDIANTTVPAEDSLEAPHLARSASVREPTKPSQPVSPGGLISKHGPIDPAQQDERRQRDPKRRTVQVEYVAPQTQTARGEVSSSVVSPTSQAAPVPASVSASASAAAAAQTKTRARADSAGGPVEVLPSPKYQQSSSTSRSQRQPAAQTSMPPPPSRPGREPPRSVSDSTAFTMQGSSAGSRSSTQGTVGPSRLPSRGNSYGQPAVPTVAQTNAEGRFSRPRPEDGTGRDSSTGRPLSQHLPADYQPHPAANQFAAPAPGRGHKRSSTVDSITKLFRSSSQRRQSQEGKRPERPEKSSRAHPPVSMKNAMPNDNFEAMGRPSTESRRTSFGFSRKNSDNNAEKRSSRRFSFLPAWGSRLSFSAASREPAYDETSGSMQHTPPRSRQETKTQPSGMAFGRGRSPSPSQSTTNSSIPVLYDSTIDSRRMPKGGQQPQRGATAPNLALYDYSRPSQAAQQPQQSSSYGASSSQYPPQQQFQQERYYTPSQSQESQATTSTMQPQEQRRAQHPAGFNSFDQLESERQQSQQQRQQVLQKPRKLENSYEGGGQHSGSSGGARRVMNWFRMRGKERSG